MRKTTQYSVSLISIFSTILVSCGGSSSSTNTQVDPVVSVNTPTELSRENWRSAKAISTSLNANTKIKVVGNKLLINIDSISVADHEHLQLYLDTDNNPDTGFQFSQGEAWAQSGSDTLIEDGDLYKSTSNNWDWNMLDPIGYSTSSNSVDIEIDLTKLGDICNTVNMGIMIRDNNWDSTSFQPIATKMKSYTLSYCNNQPQDIIPPVITISGDNPMTLEVNSPFNDPGATATDNIDGNITANIEAISTVNTSIAGIYKVNYTVTDNAGNSTTKKRNVEVTATPQTGIIIDGNASDWSGIPEHASSVNGVLKVTDTADKIYIMVNADQLGENTQLFLDIDNNQSTGLDLGQHTEAWQAGADFMVENNYLVKSTENSSAWSWGYITSLNHAKTNNILEIAINKSDINLLQNTLKIGYLSRNQNWNTVYILPPNQQMPLYNLQFPVAINPVMAVNDSAIATANQAVNIDVLANDTTTNSLALSLDSVSPPQHGTALIAQNKVIYTANAGFTGTETFSYLISDTQGHQATANITVTVNAPTNNAPNANNDTSNTAYGVAVSINVLANDTDADNDTLSISNVSNPQHGTASIHLGNTIQYTPAANYSGSDTFTYTISDGNNGSATATVTVVTAQPSNHAPIAVADSASTTGAQLVTIMALANDTDADGDSLTITNFTQPTKGLVVYTVAGGFRYTANAHTSGTDSFIYNISDGNGGTATATVTITVAATINQLPDAVEDTADVYFNETITLDVLANDTDPDGDTLTVTSIVQPPLGLAVLNADGTIFFNPQNNVGSITVIYTISDGYGGSDSATITFATTDPNSTNYNWPTLVNDTVTTKVNMPILIDVIANDSDDDGDIIHLDQVDQGSHGTTTKVNGKVLYTPNPSFTGTDSFYYGAHDGHGHGGSALVTITVNP